MLVTSYVALLRAVNVGGTGKLPMSDLKAMCEAIGFQAVRTYIASGNLVFRSQSSEQDVKAALEAQLQTHSGKAIGVAVRTAAEMAEVLSKNPFRDAPGNQVTVTFLDDVTTPTTSAGVVGRAADDEIRLGHREIYVRYGAGIAGSKLRIPAAKDGTARNMNTVAKLAAMAATT